MRTLAALLLAVGLVGPAPAEDETATIALNFQDVELPVLAKFVSEVTGQNFILDDRVRGKVTIISPTRITPTEAYLVFQSVLQVKGFTTVPSGAFVKIVPARDARETTVPTGTRRGDETVTRIIPLAHASATGLVPVLQPLVAKDGLLTAYPSTNSLIVIDSGANIERLVGLLHELDVPASERSLEVVALRFAAADELARRLREALAGGNDDGAPGLRVVADPRTNTVVLSGPPDDVQHARAIVARLDTAPLPGSARVNVYPLRYADAGSLVRVLSNLLGLPPVPEPVPAPHGSSFMRASARRAAGRGYDGEIGEPVPPPPPPALEATPATAGATMPLQAPIRVTADPATNTIIVSATPADWEMLRPVIDQLDVRRRQVFVEAIILEATLEKTRALGVDFQAAGATGNYVGLAQGNLSPPPSLLTPAANPTSVAGLLLAAASNTMVRLPNGDEVPAQTLLLTALETESDVNLLSAPTLVATDNEEAEIIVGRNVPFVASRATSSSNLENLFTTIERQDVGITLRLTPQITGDDFVRLTLFEEVSDIEPGSDVGEHAEQLGPTTTVRSARTAVAARHGQTVVIGGLLADASRSAERRVPFFGRIPVLGAFFRYDDDRRRKTNLLVFLTPYILASDEQVATRALEERERMRAALPPSRRRQPALTGRSWRPPAVEPAP